MIQHLADLITTTAGHVLAYDPTPAPFPYPTIQPADPSTPHGINFGHIFGWLLLGAVVLVLIAGLKVLAVSGSKGDLKQGFQITLGTFLGIILIVFALGGGIGIFIWLFNGVQG